MIHLDTHVAVKLYQGDVEDFSRAARRALERDPDLRMSPMAVLELDYLFEIKRIKVASTRIMAALASEIGVRVCDAPFAQVADAARDERWTRDPFDRLIVAQSKLNRSTLITLDPVIHRHYAGALQ